MPKETHKDISIPSVPPASTYRAGHYAGFHPEDQPYELSIIAIQRPATAESEQRNRAQPEPEHIVFPATSETFVLKKERESERPRHATRLTHLRAQVRLPARVRLPASVPGKALFSTRVISLGITLSCIVFLLAASIIAFVLIGKHRTEATAIVKAAPDTMRVGDNSFTLLGNGFAVGDVITFTYDGSAPILNESGQPINARVNQFTGFSVLIPVSDRWTGGVHTIDALDTTSGMDATTQITILAPSSAPPNLQLAQEQLQFPDAAAGVVSSQLVVLTNKGGGDLIWHARSDQPWLTLAPDHGTFKGSESVQITVNRGSLAAQAYTGHIVFTQQGAAASTLTIQMVVKPVPPVLAISTTSLTYTTSSLYNPVAQHITLRNTSTNVLSWSASVVINESTPWLLLTSNYGQLKPGDKKSIAVSIRAQRLLPGKYQGTINFTGGADAQVRVNLTVFAATSPVTSNPTTGGSTTHTPIVSSLPGVLPTPANPSPTAQPVVTPSPVPAINVSATKIHFSTIQGQNPSAQSVTLTNSGDADVQWSASVNDDANNVFSVTPDQGSLGAGESTSLTVSANVSNADPGTLTATIMLASGAFSQKITVDIAIKSAQPVLSISPTAITCSNASDTSASQQLSMTNKGSGTAHWSLQPASTGNDTSWLSFDSNSGELAVGENTTITIHCDGSNLSAGTYTATIDVSDSDAGVVVKSVPVTFTVS